MITPKIKQNKTSKQQQQQTALRAQLILVCQGTTQHKDRTLKMKGFSGVEQKLNKKLLKSRIIFLSQKEI